MQRYQPYDNVKPSGVKWLGDIPTHWECLQGHRLFGERKARMLADDEMLTASQKHGVIPQAEFMRLEDQKVMQVYLNAEILKHVESNDFVISMRSFQGGLEFCAYSGCVSSAYVGIFALKHVEPAFFKYLFKSRPYIQALQSTSNLVRDGQALRFQNFSMVPLPVIPDDEQKQIAAFLDYETAKIDALIEKQQQLIALLGEKRQAVISHAVTKGLNPDAPMRDSGVEWLGQVPEHWKVFRLKHAVSFLTSGPRGWSDLIADEGESVFLQSGDLTDELRLRLDTAKRITPPQNAEGVRTKMHEGDVVCCVTGANTGRIAVATKLKQTTFVNQHLALIRPIQAVAIPCFLATLMSATPTKTYFSIKQYGLKEGLSLTNVAETPICLPPLPEQVKIVAYLDAMEAKMHRLRESADAQVDLLQERRTALISAAVTGKIDVRGWKRPTADRPLDAEIELA